MNRYNDFKFQKIKMLASNSFQVTQSVLSPFNIFTLIENTTYCSMTFTEHNGEKSSDFSLFQTQAV